MANLAARCPACNTAFRVVPDQLRVSEGWVRCGRCGEVFNANQTLIDLDTGVSAEPEVPREPAPLLDRLLPPPPPDALPEPTPSGLEFDLQIAPATPGGASVAAPESAPAGIEASPAPHPFAADPRAVPEDRPSFVRRAERAEVWRQPKVRIVLAVLTVLAGLGLLAQTAFDYRDLIAARLPVARAALQGVCAALNCRVGPVHAIESLAVESSGLVWSKSPASTSFSWPCATGPTSRLPCPRST